MTLLSELRLTVDVSAIPARPAGAGRYVLDLVEALGERDDVVMTLITRTDDEQRWTAFSRVNTLALAPASVPLRLAYGEFALGTAVRRHGGTDVLHGPHYTLPLWNRLPSVVTIHDLTLLEHPEWHEPSKVVFFRHALRVAARRAKVVVVPSEFVASAYRRHFGEQLAVRVIPHGVDHRRFTADPVDPTSDERVLGRLGVSWPYVLNVGTLEPRKNQPLLVAAFSKVAHTNSDLRLVLAGGSGWKSEALDQAIAVSGVAERIVRLGYVDDLDVPPLLRSATAVAYPSFEEGFGIPALEALACGAPLITTKASAMAEVTADAALLVDANDVTSLADALADVIEGGSAVAKRRSLGLVRASDYTWAASASAHMAAYEVARSS